MKPLPLLMIAGLCTYLSAADSARADALADVQKKIHDKVSAAKSMSFKMKMTTEMTQPMMSLKSESESVYEAVRKGPIVMTRADMKTKNLQKMGDTETKTNSTMTTVSDGKTTLTYSESDGQKSATRMKLDPKTEYNPFEAMRGFKELEKSFSIKLLPDEKTDGMTCWVLETLPKEETMRAFMGKSLSYYDQATGIAVKSIGYDKDGKVMTTSVTTDIKINTDIKPERFEFKVPAGVKIEEVPAAEDSESAASKPAKPKD